MTLRFVRRSSHRARRAFVATMTIGAVLSLVPARVPAQSAAHERRLSFDVRDVAIGDALARLAARFGASVVVEGTFARRVSLALHAVTFREAVAALLEPAHIAYDMRDGVLTVHAAANAAPRVVVTARPRVASEDAQPVAIGLTNADPARAARLLRSYYPHARIDSDAEGRALIVVASAHDVAGMRELLRPLDERDPRKPTASAIAVHNANVPATAARLAALFPNARVAAGPNRTLLVTADAADLAQISSLVEAVDAAAPTPTPAPATDTVRVVSARPADVARAVARAVPAVRVDVAGNALVYAGPADDVARARVLTVALDVPAPGARFAVVYRLNNVEAASIADLVRKTFPAADVTADAEVNALSVVADARLQRRIADGIAQLDGTNARETGASAPQPGASGEAALSGPAGNLTNIEVVRLKAALPGVNGAASTSASEIAATVSQTLQAVTPDLHINVPTDASRLILSGSPNSIRIAKQLIAKLDAPGQLVVLDTQILEIDENVARNLGFAPAQGSILTTTYSESTPPPNANGFTPLLLGLQPLQRTPLSLQFQLGLAISHGQGRILSDPRITTLSGHTATIRAGDNLSVLTQTGGGTGVAVTQQLQTFQTGVSLDITPVVNDEDYITIALHPVVNNVSSFGAGGIPQISTRDTQTTVGMHEGQTLVIGGLIQENNTRTEIKTPLLGDLPVIGKVFRNVQVNKSRSELIVTITPHVVTAQNAALVGPAPLPTPSAYATLAPSTSFPATRALGPRVRATGAGAPIVVHVAPPQGAPPDAASAAPDARATAPPAATTPGSFVYGQPPANPQAVAQSNPNDPPQIFYVTFSPTTLRPFTQAKLSATTTGNITTLTIGVPGGSKLTLSPTSTGQWSKTFALSALGIPAGTTSINLTLQGSRADGSAAAVAIPITIAP